MKEQSAPWDAFTDPRTEQRFAELKTRIAELEAERSDVHDWFSHRHVYGSLSLEQIDAMTPRQMADYAYERKANQVEELKEDAVAKYAEEKMTVARVWDALGISTYEQAKPLAIWEHVSRLKAALREARVALDKVNEWYEDKHEFAVDFFEDIEKQIVATRITINKALGDEK